MTRQLLNDSAKPTLRDRDRGFTMVEMVAVLALAAIIAGFAIPSFLSLNKPLRDGVQQVKNQLSLIRSKAISSSQAYRLRPKYSTRSQYTDSRPNSFVVEYATNCRVTATGGTNGWQMASQFDLNLPSSIGITDVASTTINDPTGTGSISNNLSWSICFDNRGIVDTPTKFLIKDFRGDNRAKMALIEVGKVGSVDINTYSNTAASNPAKIALDSQNNPVF